MSHKKKCDDDFVLDSDFGDNQSQNYDIITINTRIQLIKLVCIQDYKISQAAKQLNINQSSAKYIVRTFRKKGKILLKLPKNQQLTEQQLNQLEMLKSRQYVPNQREKNSPKSKIREKKIKKINKQIKSQASGQIFQKKLEASQEKDINQNIQTYNPYENFPIYFNPMPFIPVFVNPVNQYLWPMVQGSYYH